MLVKPTSNTESFGHKQNLQGHIAPEVGIIPISPEQLNICQKDILKYYPIEMNLKYQNQFGDEEVENVQQVEEDYESVGSTQNMGVRASHLIVLSRENAYSQAENLLSKLYVDILLAALDSEIDDTIVRSTYQSSGYLKFQSMISVVEYNDEIEKIFKDSFSINYYNSPKSKLELRIKNFLSPFMNSILPEDLARHDCDDEGYSDDFASHSASASDASTSPRDQNIKKTAKNKNNFHKMFSNLPETHGQTGYAQNALNSNASSSQFYPSLYRPQPTLGTLYAEYDSEDEFGLISSYTGTNNKNNSNPVKTTHELQLINSTSTSLSKSTILEEESEQLCVLLYNSKLKDQFVEVMKNLLSLQSCYYTSPVMYQHRYQENSYPFYWEVFWGNFFMITFFSKKIKIS